MSNQPLNWLSITAGSLLATLLLITGAQAAEAGLSAPNSPDSTLLADRTLRHRSNELIALRQKQRAQLKIKRQAKVTATVAPTVADPTDLAQLTPPAPTDATPTTAPAEAPKTETPVPNQFSLNTKLEGQVIFGATGTFTGDFERNPAFG
ncbi:hypothetical protein, partial [Chamaesiphon sp.]|uniref:hypothetical protein n=1 Tax=Chamaesiphon sp. TaxID=2814140 RepID=UPI00359491DA